MPTHYGGWPVNKPTEPIIERPCFVCGEMMEIVKPTRQLKCARCDVLEAGDLCMSVSTLAATHGTWQGEDVTYIDHTDGKYHSCP